MESTITRLLRGSQEIDRMRSEIKQITLMICGLVREAAHASGNFPHNLQINYQEGNIRWILRVGPGGVQYVYAYVGWGEREDWNGISLIPLEWIKAVHSTLPGFVKTMTEPWPKVVDKLNLLLIEGDLALSRSLYNQ